MATDKPMTSILIGGNWMAPNITKIILSHRLRPILLEFPIKTILKYLNGKEAFGYHRQSQRGLRP